MSPEEQPSGQIGVDQWVAQSGERREAATGSRRLLAQFDQRVGWWPRLAVAALAGLVFGLATGNVNLLTVGFTCLLYAILSLGLNISVGWAGLLDLGYIAFVGFGAYGYAIFSSTALGTNNQGGSHLAAFESIPIVVLAAGIAGAVIGVIALRLEGDYLAIVTLFLGQAFADAVNNVDTGTFGGVNGIYNLDSLHGFSGTASTPRGLYIVALIVCAVLAGILHLLDTSRTGRAWRALQDDPLAARAMTMPVKKLKVMAYSFGGAVGALGGALFAAQQSSVFPTNFTETVLILIFACLVLGGAGSIAGAILGGVLVQALEFLLASPKDSAYLFYALVLIALVWKIRPWRYLAAVLAGTVALGLVAHAVVGAISSSATGGSPGSTGWIGSVVSHWVIVPVNAATYGNILFVVIIGCVIALMRVQGIRRLALVIVTVYVGACCWEARLIVNPAITTQIMIGAILVVTMAIRPNGLLGRRRVEIV